MHVITHFSSMEDMEAYLVHPVHVEVSKYIAEVLESGASICYESAISMQASAVKFSV
ncbi:MAG: hypothetical protein E7243_01145 [Lacrimispora celerecrescens]|uniref:Dabb family protein n=1 Tax=Lacrimispora indolis TaxID=69825 RepID=UPI000A02A506|nr:hypothetical protein [Lacrimispora celerecrescens]